MPPESRPAAPRSEAQGGSSSERCPAEKKAVLVTAVTCDPLPVAVGEI